MTLYPGVGQMERRDIFSMNWLAEQEDKYYIWLRSKTYQIARKTHNWSYPASRVKSKPLGVGSRRELASVVLQGLMVLVLIPCRIVTEHA